MATIGTPVGVNYEQSAKNNRPYGKNVRNRTKLVFAIVEQNRKSRKGKTRGLREI